jgi:hypothetical protein
VKPRGEFFLRQVEGAADDRHLRDPLHARQPLWGQGPRIRIGESGGMNVFIRHHIRAASIARRCLYGIAFARGQLKSREHPDQSG